MPLRHADRRWQSRPDGRSARPGLASTCRRESAPAGRGRRREELAAPSAAARGEASSTTRCRRRSVTVARPPATPQELRTGEIDDLRSNSSVLTPTGPGTRGHTAGARGSERPAGQRPRRDTGTGPARGSRESVCARGGGGAAPAARPAPGAQQAHGQTWAGASLRPSSPSGRAKPPRFPWRPYCEVGVWSEQLLDGAPAVKTNARPALRVHRGRHGLSLPVTPSPRLVPRCPRGTRRALPFRVFLMSYTSAPGLAVSTAFFIPCCRTVVRIPPRQRGQAGRVNETP